MEHLKSKKLDSEGKVLKSYKNDYLKTDKKDISVCMTVFGGLVHLQLKMASVYYLWFFLMEIIKSQILI